MLLFFLKVIKARQECYLNKVTATETVMEIPLQDLLNHTAIRLLKGLNLDFPKYYEIHLTLIVKYGFDETNCKNYKQKANQSGASCSNLFCSSLLPLQKMNKKYWTNPRPSSTRFCRPIQIAFEKETKEFTKAKEAWIKSQIDELQDFIFESCRLSFELI